VIGIHSKNKGSSISFLEILTMARDKESRQSILIRSRNSLTAKKSQPLLKNAVNERSEMALIVISSMN
jgi:hypothetical protein